MRYVPLVAALAITLAASYAEDACAQGTPITNQTRQALRFYGGRSAASTLSEMPRRTPIQPASSGQLQHNGKPFQTATTGPTISPYLNLFRDEQIGSHPVPAYYAMVRPQFEQQAAYQQQQRELQRLQQQVQSVGPGSTVVPGSGTQARYFDTAQFYGGWQR